MSTTVGITCHNKHDTIARAIESALKFGDEVIVIDNASTDESQKVIHRYDVRSVLHADDHGYRDSLNRLIGMAECDYLILLDGDDFLTNSPLAVHMEQGDWCVGPLYVANERGYIVDVWEYEGRPTTYEDAVAFIRDYPTLPLPVKACLRVGWLREHGLSFDNPFGTGYGEDVWTCLEWLKTKPDVRFAETGCYAYLRQSGDPYAEARNTFWNALFDYLGGIE